MRIDGSQLLLFTLGCLAAVLLAAGLFRIRQRSLAWLALCAGLGGLALLALAQFTGRLGPEHLWFREPTFYVALVALLAAGAWWLRRPAPRALRFGLPAALLAFGGAVVLLSRLDGRSTPIALSMPTLNRPAPEIVYLDEHGRKQHLANLRGRVVLVNFWATWCVPCRREMPMLSKMQREYADQGLVVLYISLEEPEVLGPFLANNHFDGVQARLDRAADYYDAGKIYPLSYLVSRHGEIAHRWSGRPSEDWLSSQIRALL